MRFVITGAPRSATRYAAALMRELEVPCTHEQVFRPDSQLVDVLRWYRSADSGESCWMAWTLLGALPVQVPVLHTRRNPWKVIDSLAHRNNIIRPDKSQTPHQTRMRNIVESYCPRVAEQRTAVDRAACMVVDWNRRIETVAEEHASRYLSYRVEDLNRSLVATLLGTIGYERSPECIDRALDTIPTTSNQGRDIHRDVPISDPLVARFIAQTYPGMRQAVRRITPMTTSKTPDELADMMSADLLYEVNEYADAHGYPTVDVPQPA